MGRHTFTFEINDFLLGAALARAKREGKSPEDVIATLIASYAKGESMSSPSPSQAPPPPPSPHPSPSPLPAPEPPTESATPAPVQSPTPPVPTPSGAASEPIPNESYTAIPMDGPATDRPADIHADLNLGLRGYVAVSKRAGLVDLGGPADNQAPQLPGLFADNRTPELTQTYRIHHWNWGPPPNIPGSRGGQIDDPEVTLVGLAVQLGETIHVPQAGYEVYTGGYQAVVLYATPERITLTYTRQDSIIKGYAMHIEGVHPEPSLLALYERMNAAGRRQMPGLKAGQAVGRAIGDEIKLSIRDTGRFMDPRIRKDWWVGR